MFYKQFLKAFISCFCENDLSWPSFYQLLFDFNFVLFMRNCYMMAYQKQIKSFFKKKNDVCKYNTNTRIERLSLIRLITFFLDYFLFHRTFYFNKKLINEQINVIIKMILNRQIHTDRHFKILLKMAFKGKEDKLCDYG